MDGWLDAGRAVSRKHCNEGEGASVGVWVWVVTGEST